MDDATDLVRRRAVSAVVSSHSVRRKRGAHRLSAGKENRVESRSSAAVQSQPYQSTGAGEQSPGRQSPSELAHHLRGLFSQEVGPERFARFFDQQTLVAVVDDAVDVTVPNDFTRDLLERRFGCDLRRVLRDESDRRGRALALHFRVDRSAFGGGGSTPAPTGSARAEPLRTRSRSNGRSADRLEARHQFAGFVVGEANKVAYAAARRLAEETAISACSPLFIHGACGLGKTHLLQSVVNRFREVHPRGRVLYTTAESFTNEFVMAIQSGSMNAFRRLYRNVDLLCIDDLHFVAGKEATQAELLHTLDAIGVGRARIAMASDAHPRAIRKFSDALVSRLVSGAVVRLDAPDLDLRTRIVAHIAERRGLHLADGAARLIAEHGHGAEGVSVRDVEGVLTQVEAVWRLLPDLASSDGGIGAAIVQNAMDMRRQGGGRSVGRRTRPIPVETIISIVCRDLDVEMSDFLGSGRHRRVVLARALVVYAARDLTTRSYPEIASAMRRPNHSSVVSAFTRLNKQIADKQIVRCTGKYDGLTMGDLADRLIEHVRREASASPAQG